MLEVIALQDLQSALNLRPKGILVASMKVRRYSIQIDFFSDRKDVSEVSFTPTMEFRRHEHGPIDDSSGRRHRSTDHLFFPTVIVQVIERPLGLSLTTAEPIHQQIEANGLLGRESFLYSITSAS